MKPLFIIAAMFVLLTLRLALGAPPPETPLTRLQDGNARFISGHSSTEATTVALRTQLAEGQHPVACIVTCSDSRVSPELLFDQALGDLFVVRVAGNVISPEVLGSVEYAVEHLRTPLVVVLGHTDCGAVKAALTETHPQGMIGSLIRRLEPTVQAVREKGYPESEVCAAAVRENARRGAESLLDGSRVLDEAVRNGEATVLSAVYDMQSGAVAWQTQLCVPVSPAPVAVQAVATPPAPAPAPEPKLKPAAPAKEIVPAKDNAEAPRPQTVDPSSAYARRHR
jgi:carbonic anhydrase